ncbi:cytochrome P450 307a1-like isoform X2 [Scaptodrosophila lebanonensis]|uniref:Cytochrome P450 307a1-like isoform X2 n=1 Tax=Drosophila lebanonensis TaxID=7225 RepID=A0A6J2TTN1_DROLE|nr:cytochrome P450 307a1-like isoform X2 [Scaptodrosophila lebanonensis]
MHSEKTLKKFAQAPGPHPWPIIGNLDRIGRNVHNPFEGLTELAAQYGDIYSLTLGHTRCLVVSSLDLIREVLNQNGKFFAGRPDFLRYHKLFGNDRNNSLALCDWSQLQQKRRNLARRHCSPRESSSYFTKMSQIGCNEVDKFLNELNKIILPGQSLNIKPLILQACANMFSQYMCSQRFQYNDVEFGKVVRYFDEIFWEINQGYALDFLPWLSPFYKNHIQKIVHWSTTIRKFILDRVINEREVNVDFDEPDNDFTDALLKSGIENESVSRNTIIFMLEDFIGGHSAVGNLVMLALGYIAKDRSIGVQIQKEADIISNNGQRRIELNDMKAMPFTMATILEVLRSSSSPIVPHVATEDAVISGFGVTVGTIVLINNYALNTSEQYWDLPKQFNPERFLEKVPHASGKGISKCETRKRRNSEGSDSGIEFEKQATQPFTQSEGLLPRNYDFDQNDSAKSQPYKFILKKNIPHFLPFSIGKRTCIGQSLVRGFGFILLANIIQRYNVTSADVNTIKINPASIALPANSYSLVLTSRN